MVLSDGRPAQDVDEPKANETTVGTLHAPHCAKSGNCLGAGFLPFDQFPRTGDWEELVEGEHLPSHIRLHAGRSTLPGAGIRPFRGQGSIDRYEAVDFDDQVDTLRKLGLWFRQDARISCVRLGAAEALGGKPGSNDGATVTRTQLSSLIFVCRSVRLREGQPSRPVVLCALSHRGIHIY